MPRRIWLLAQPYADSDGRIRVRKKAAPVLVAIEWSATTAVFEPSYLLSVKISHSRDVGELLSLSVDFQMLSKS